MDALAEKLPKNCAVKSTTSRTVGSGPEVTDVIRPAPDLSTVAVTNCNTFHGGRDPCASACEVAVSSDTLGQIARCGYVRK